MSEVKAKAKRQRMPIGRASGSSIESSRLEPPPDGGIEMASRGHVKWRRIIAVIITLATVAVAAVVGRNMWRTYVEAPWTRDATVRAYIVTMAPEVSGRIVELGISDNQFVHKGDLLMVIDPTNYKIAVSRGEAVLQQAILDGLNIAREAQRREGLAKLDAVALEQLQLYQSNASIARAKVQQATADLHQARVNLERTRILAPVEGWVTNLLARRDDYADIGQSEVSLVDSDSFWVDAYFEENQLAAIREGDAATIKLMGYRPIVRGHVAGISRGIDVANAQPNQQGLATVNPIFPWVRLAQRIPVRIRLDQVPKDVRLVAGLTATVEIESAAASSAKTENYNNAGK
jgi:RND family efflux transporter MFP subunit